MQIVIDCYGHPSNSERYQRANFEKKAYLVDKVGGNTTYVCFDRTDKRPIHRITVSGTETIIEWTVGVWVNRAGLTYSNTLNESIAVDENDIGKELAK